MLKNLRSRFAMSDVIRKSNSADMCPVKRCKSSWEYTRAIGLTTKVG